MEDDDINNSMEGEEKTVIYRERACGALIKEDKILMVYIEQATRKFWTLPGGGIEEGETPEQACIREFKEETGLNVESERFLFEYVSQRTNKTSKTSCFLLRIKDDYNNLKLGYDPEKLDNQELKDIKWQPMREFKDDVQVSKVIKALGL